MKGKEQNPALEPVKVEKEGPIAILTLQNPPYNVLTSRVLDALAEAAVAMTDDPQVRCIILTGSGDKAFSSGANIKEMAGMTLEEAVRYSAKGQALTNLLERSPVPVIAAIRGFCLGGGCEISLACDFIVAASDAVFAQPEINIGVLPGWGGSRRLTRAIGVARARHWILTGEKVPAEVALRDGLVDRVVPPAKLLEEAKSLAKVLASKGSTAIAAAKYAVNYASDATRLLGLEYERDLWGVLFQTEDQKEGMKAFLEKREPRFQGRTTWGSREQQYPWKEQWAAYEEAKKEIGVDHPDYLMRPWMELWERSGRDLLGSVLDLSVSTATTYQEWVDRAWKMAMGPARAAKGNP
jgi:enoyl-CoA hydratase